jgi:hypothetical protein
MNSYVEYWDDKACMSRRVQLVYPHRADFSEGRISVLSRIGAALLGLMEGQSINWQTRNKDKQRLTVLRVSGEPFFRESRRRPVAPINRAGSPTDAIRSWEAVRPGRIED